MASASDGPAALSADERLELARLRRKGDDLAGHLSGALGSKKKSEDLG